MTRTEPKFTSNISYILRVIRTQVASNNRLKVGQKKWMKSNSAQRRLLPSVGLGSIIVASSPGRLRSFFMSVRRLRFMG